MFDIDTLNALFGRTDIFASLLPLLVLLAWVLLFISGFDGHTASVPMLQRVMIIGCQGDLQYESCSHTLSTIFVYICSYLCVN